MIAAHAEDIWRGKWPMDIVQNLDQMIDKYFDYCNEMVHSRTYNGIENLCWSQEVKK